jgi:hypothetical protein
MSGLLTEKRVVSLIILVLSFGLVLSTFGREFADLGGAFSPMFFPRIILMILLALSALNLVIDLRAQDRSQPIELWPVVIVGIAFLCYVLLIGPLGYFLSSTAVGIAILLAMGLRNPVQVILIPLVCAGALVALFNHTLKMPLPTSPLFWWI